MQMTRRRLLGTAVVLGLAGCARTTPAPATSTPATAAVAAPPATIDGPGALVDRIAADPDRATLLVDDGRGTVLTHLADRPRPIASAGKVVPLVAYAQAVAAGRLDPAAPVAVDDWERWYVPGTDGGAHPRALEALGAGPGGTVRWDDLVAVMIGHSDNAVPDLIRDTLGDQALVDAAASGGWGGLDLPSYAGESLLAPGPLPAGTDRRAAAVAAARSYAGDPAQRAAAARRATELGAEASATPSAAPSPAEVDTSVQPILRWFDGAPAATVTQLAGIHRAVATGSPGPQASALARGHLERALAAHLPAGVVGAGEKGGNLPGIVCDAVTLRRTDGTVAVSVLSLSGMPWQAYTETLASGALLLAQQVLVDDALLARLRTAVTGR